VMKFLHLFNKSYDSFAKIQGYEDIVSKSDGPQEIELIMKTMSKYGMEE